MIKIRILTLFPEFFQQFLLSSIIGRSVSRGLVEFSIINIRDYSLDKNHRVDDHPIGGGAGLIMRLEPLLDCLRKTDSIKSHKILLSPKGKKYTQKDAVRLSNEQDITLICGHYEGIDARFESYVDEEISIGDFILTGGEIGAMAIADSIVRLLKGAIREESTEDESFQSELLEYPQYTYPLEYEGQKIPDILFCGNHKAIEEYHRKESLKETYHKRPDLLNSFHYRKEDIEFLNMIKEGREKLTKTQQEALEKGSRFIKN